MKKGMIKALIAALALIIVGGLISFLVLWNLRFDYRKLGTDQRIRTETEVKDPFTDIRIENDSCDLKLVSSKDNAAHVYYEGSDRYLVETEVRNGTLHVTVQDNIGSFDDAWKDRKALKKFISNLVLSIEDTQLTVAVPSGPEDPFFGTTAVEASSGDVEISGLHSAAVSVTTTSGSADLKNLAAGSFEVKSASGDVEIENVLPLSTASVHTESGEIKLEKLELHEKLEVSSSSGEIELDTVSSAGSFEISSSSGEISFEDCTAQSVSVSSQSGSIHGNFLNPMVFDASSGSGFIRVPDSVTGAPCRVQTGSGNIDLTVGKD